jgi:uncharacterized protein YcbX
MLPLPLGRVSQIWYYPVKSMRGVALPQAAVHWMGLPGDRQHAFTFTDDRSGFPWLTYLLPTSFHLC